MENLVVLKLLKEGLRNQLLVLKSKNHEAILAGLETNSTLLKQSFLFISRYENHSIFKTESEIDFIDKLPIFYKDIDKINLEKVKLTQQESEWLIAFRIIIDALEMRLYKMVNA